MDPVAQYDRPSQVQQSNVTVQVFLPVVLGVHNDSIDGHDLLKTAFKPGKFKSKTRWCKKTMESSHTRRLGVLLGPVVFSDADQDVILAEVLVPGWVEDAVSCGEDPLIADQTGPTQQLLGVPFVQHHLPARGSVSSHQQGQDTNIDVATACSSGVYHGAEANSASSPPTMRCSRYDSKSSTSFASFLFIFSNRGR